MTLHNFKPSGAQVSAHEIHWHFENFEPSLSEGTGQISVDLLDPEYDLRIQEAEKYLADHPDDGDAWGRVGKAYKEAGMIGYGWGFRDDATGAGMFQKSTVAYQKAVDLLPEDADWHYGYAELLCEDVLWKNGPGEVKEKYTSQVSTCFRELNRALKLNSQNQDALNLLNWLTRFKITDATPAPTLTFAPPELFIIPSWTPTRSVTPSLAPSSTSTLTPPVPSGTPTGVTTSTPEAAAGGVAGLCGGALMLGVLAGLVLLKIKRR